jgi:hypothetical protein
VLVGLYPAGLWRGLRSARVIETETVFEATRPLLLHVYGFTCLDRQHHTVHISIFLVRAKTTD